MQIFFDSVNYYLLNPDTKLYEILSKFSLLSLWFTHPRGHSFRLADTPTPGSTEFTPCPLCPFSNLQPRSTGVNVNNAVSSASPSIAIKTMPKLVKLECGHIYHEACLWGDSEAKMSFCIQCDKENGRQKWVSMNEEDYANWTTAQDVKEDLYEFSEGEDGFEHVQLRVEESTNEDFLSCQDFSSLVDVIMMTQQQKQE